jgi:hypothetical protein
MKFYFCKKLFKTIPLLISFISLSGSFLNAEFLYKELQIDSSTKSEEDNSVIPTNPFEIVEMMRRYNSLNDATNPSDAIDDALKSFKSLEEE